MVAWVGIDGLGCLGALVWSWPPTTNHVLILMVATTLSIDIGLIALAWSWPVLVDDTLSRHGVAWVGIAIGLDCLVAWVGIAIGLGCLVALACKWPPTTTHVLTLLVAVAIGLVALACMWQPTTNHVLLATSLSTHHGVALVGIAIVLECLVAHLALVGLGPMWPWLETLAGLKLVAFGKCPAPMHPWLKSWLSWPWLVLSPMPWLQGWLAMPCVPTFP